MDDPYAAVLAPNGWIDHPDHGDIIPIPDTEAGVKYRDDGCAIVVVPLLFGAAAIALERPGQMFRQDYWRYTDRRTALDAAVAWDGDGEPAGWAVHPATGRRAAP